MPMAAFDLNAHHRIKSAFTILQWLTPLQTQPLLGLCRLLLLQTSNECILQTRIKEINRFCINTAENTHHWRHVCIYTQLSLTNCQTIGFNCQWPTKQFQHLPPRRRGHPATSLPVIYPVKQGNPLPAHVRINGLTQQIRQSTFRATEIPIDIIHSLHLTFRNHTGLSLKSVGAPETGDISPRRELLGLG